MKAQQQVFPSLASYNQALNDLGARRIGHRVLAISAAGTPSFTGRQAKREGSWHSHHRGQLMCVKDGLLHVRTTHGSWAVPPGRAAWVPPGVPHAVNSNGVSHSWHLYLSPAASRPMPPRPCVIEVNPLIEDIVPRAVLWTAQERLDAAQGRLMAVLIDELASAPHDRMQLPIPRDRRLLRIATAILDNPADTRTRDEWAAWAGLSSRTLTRLFQEEVRISFAQWREQAALMAAVDRLAHGESVASVADALGYATPSGFIAMFRRHFGEPPARYFASQ
ncbi:MULTISPECIES: AraC family transcriptional regulator [Ramlibacter]|uniref:Helix-turn-helix domain-containing protein n=1 Tax=Ramlibacter pinisoli TaxID=2682844 RepID=A0A6N8IZS7_9BURK|nr:MULTISPECIES: helix-turn-helix transcriptional regulator [Ramlibacter]MBA2962163.1 helix-turn-helix transcriptional regulator [Ramlibacter sp. CGMCC 1.13660]MVQ32105.1 helix-turn-helix domain-containing protein [Ramlibacter pinisoli]